MATISEIAFTISRTTTYPSVLAAADGRLTTRARYQAMFDALERDLTLPWRTYEDRPGWSRFWSSYLGKVDALRTVGADSAWEHLIPFQYLHDDEIAGPDGAAASSRVLIYPGAIAVIITVRWTGTWPVGRLADAVRDLRTARVWGSTGNRRLEGIASHLRTAAAAKLVPAGAAPPVADTEVVHTVAAPIAGTGQPAELALTDPTAGACAAGLAVLGPPGTLASDKLLSANSDANLAARCYLVTGGHVIWRPDHMLAPPANDALGCLVRNHTDLVAHIDALGGMVTWAADLVARDADVANSQQLATTAAGRLRVLQAGNRRNTYRSEIAAKRIAPFQDAMTAVLAAL